MLSWRRQMNASSSHPAGISDPQAAACAIAPASGCNVVMSDDSILLRRYVTERSEAAFAELVQRKTGLVYSAALRQVGGDTLLAQDVAQSVFIDLARKARELTDHPALTSWLYTSTRFAALKALRANQRRHIRELEAQTMEDIERETADQTDWNEVRPLIDSAICDLSENDRAAVLMRYFEDQPFAAMGEKLGIGESSARMRAERALDKLRATLAKKGIASTSAALGLALATKAVAAPPIGLAATLANAALAYSTAAASGAGVAAKVSKVTLMNKVPTSVFAVATAGAAGVATYQMDAKATATAFLIYTISFGVGLVFTIASALGAHLFGGHGELGHDVQGGHGGHQGHAEAGSGANDMPGFSPVSPTTIASFITAFGGFGMIFSQIEATHNTWISAPLAALGGLGIAAGVFAMFNALFRKTQGTSEGRVAELAGTSATVITPIAPGGVGEIAYVQSGTRYSAPARAEGAETFTNCATVRITRIVGTQFYVASA